MMSKRNKSSFQKNGYLHKHRQKIISPRKARKEFLALAGISTCQTNGEISVPAVSGPNAAIASRKIDFPKSANDNATVRICFQKFKDKRAKKSVKRLYNHRSQQNNCDYSQRLVKSIKRRAFAALARNATATNPKRRLDFAKVQQRQTQSEAQSQIQTLPKPKFYRNEQQARGSRTLLNDTIEEGEIFEEIVSSDDDDCIVLEPEVTNINLDDDSSDVPPEKPKTASEQDEADNIPSCSHFEVDKKREGKLYELWSKTPGRGFVYPVRTPILNTSNDSCIIIEESVEHKRDNDSPVTIVDDRLNQSNFNRKPKPKQDSISSLDDSVIFLEADFIPLPIDEAKQKTKRNRKRRKVMLQDADLQEEIEEKKVEKVEFKSTEEDTTEGEEERTVVRPVPPKMYRHRMNPSLFTTNERKKLADYNSNTYNPGKEMSGQPLSNKRPVIIDGSNVAFSHGCSNMFSAEGIKYCVEFFHKMGHDVKAVIPLFRRNPNKSTNPSILDQLHRDNKIVFTPCKNLPTQQCICYDDRFILQLAYERNAAVVSNDNYRDLIDESPAFKKIIENRVIGYSWCDNILILPKDPYGRFGPPLSEILRRN